MATRKLTAAARVRAFIKTNPEAKPPEVAAATGVKLTDVHNTLWRDRTAGVPKRRYKTRAKKADWETIAVVTTDTPMHITMEEPNVDGDIIKLGDVVGGLVLTDMGNGKARWIRQEEPKVDMVNSPPHYKVGGIEVIDFIKAKLTPDEFRGYLQGNILKYSSRVGYKGDAAEDVGKLIWYANKLQETFPT